LAAHSRRRVGSSAVWMPSTSPTGKPCDPMAHPCP